MLAAALVLFALFLLAPPTANAASVDYSGQTSPQDNSDDGIDNPEPRPFSLTVDAGKVTKLAFSATLRCPDGSGANKGYDYDAERGDPPVPIVDGAFELRWSRSDGNGDAYVVKGSISDGTASGTVHVEAHEFSGVAPEGDICSADITWTAKRVSVEPPPSTSPRRSTRPFATWVLDGLRARTTPTAGYPYKHAYAIGLTPLSCFRANYVLVRVGRAKAKRVSCRPEGKISSPTVINRYPLRPRRHYQVRVTPVRIRRGRVIKRGRTMSQRFYLAGSDSLWTDGDTDE